MTKRTITAFVIVVGNLASSTVSAAEVKDILEHERALLAGQCTQIEFYPGFVEITDINGDGRDDAIIDYQYLQCDGSRDSFCGSGGCTLRLYSGAPNGLYAEAGQFYHTASKCRGAAVKRGSRYQCTEANAVGLGPLPARSWDDWGRASLSLSASDRCHDSTSL